MLSAENSSKKLFARFAPIVAGHSLLYTFELITLMSYLPESFHQARC